jgi:hypothetical protein
MISSSPAYFEQILPHDASCWEIDIDPEMAILDDWINKQVREKEIKDKKIKKI